MQFVPGKIFLGGFPADTTKEVLFAYCAQWGDLSDVHIMTGKNYGFVTFQNPADAQAFLDIRDHTINGRHVDAKAAVPRDQGGGRMTKKMFVGGVVDVSDEDFREYFSQFGEIENAAVIRKQDGTSRGYGFVTFRDEVSVEKCLVQEHYFHGKPIDCKRAVARDQQGGRGDGAQANMHPGMQHSNSGMMMNPAAAAALMMNPAAAAAMMNSGAGMGMMFPMNPFMMGGGGGSGAGGMGGGMGNSSKGGDRGQDRPRHPEWTCPECGNTNFAWRQACNKCKRSRPGGMPVSGDGDNGDMMGMMGGGGMNPFAFGMPGVAGAGIPPGMPGMNLMGGQVMNPNMLGMMGSQSGMDPSLAASMMGGGTGTGTYGRAGGRGGNNSTSNNSQTRFRPY